MSDARNDSPDVQVPDVQVVDATTIADLISKAETSARKRTHLLLHGGHHDQVLAAVIVKVAKKRARRVFEDPDAGRFSDVFEGSIPSVSIEAVGKAGRLADVKIVEPIVVDVSK